MAEASLAVQGINKLRLELSHKDNELSLTKEKGKIGHFIYILELMSLRFNQGRGSNIQNTTYVALM